MTNVLFCWILLRTIAMLFSMLCMLSFCCLNSISYCVFADYLPHNANVVHVFVYQMLHSSKILFPQVSHLHYFSDGALFQYKNFKNLTNLIHHQGDHQLSAEWHFFATSYGKSSCDGIGDTVNV